jgi:hypothetical protein
LNKKKLIIVFEDDDNILEWIFYYSNLFNNLIDGNKFFIYDNNYKPLYHKEFSKILAKYFVEMLQKCCRNIARNACSI